MAYEVTMKEKESSMMRKSARRMEECEASSFDRLKEEEANRWEEIISLVQSQISRTVINNAELCNFMQQIMDISMKNRQKLEESPR